MAGWLTGSGGLVVCCDVFRSSVCVCVWENNAPIFVCVCVTPCQGNFVKSHLGKMRGSSSPVTSHIGHGLLWRMFSTFEPPPCPCTSSPGSNHPERTAEERPGRPGGEDPDPGLVRERDQTRGLDEQVDPQRGVHRRRRALPPADGRLLPLFAVQGRPVQSGLRIQWNCQGA